MRLPGVSDWLLYMVRCSDGSLYTGITRDLERRLEAHRNGRGAKYFRGRSPVTVVHVEYFPDRASASRREHVIKAMRKAEKEALLST